MKRHTKHLVDVLLRLDRVCRGAEVGVWQGRNAFHLLNTFKELKLILVDDYDKHKVKKNGLDHRTTQAAKIQAFENLREFNHRCKWLEMESSEAVKQVDDRSLDFVFLDADHWYDSVKLDIETWLPKIRLGGVLAGDDFSGHFHGIKRAVREKFGFKGFKVEGNIIWYHIVGEEK